jgi:hypothetical protein
MTKEQIVTFLDDHVEITDDAVTTGSQIVTSSD